MEDDQLLLYGADPMERIVAVEIVGRQAVLFCRDRDDKLVSRREPFTPWFLTAKPEWLPKTTAEACQVRPLKGKGELSHLVEADDWHRMWGLIGGAVASYNEAFGTSITSWRDVPGLHVMAWPETQFLVRSGKSFFKSMQFEELHRLQLDLEVLCGPRSRFPNPAEPQAAIIIAALSDNRGWCELIDLREMTETELLRKLVQTIRAKDPDVIEGHNLLGFDLPYLMRRCERCDVKLAIGRDGSEPTVFKRANSSRMRSFSAEDIHVFGRHLVDTLPLVQRQDTGKAMESYSLKAAAIHFGFASADRTYVAGDEIQGLWRSDPERLLAYARDDVMETEAVARLLTLPLFYQTQMVPMTYERLIGSGVTTRIEALFMREHLRVGAAVPVPDPPREYSGGYTHTFIRGMLKNVMYVDVHSLYPSIITAFGICPAKDELQLVPRSVHALLSRRLQAKRMASTEADPTERRRQLAISDSFKNVVNSIYGYLGFGAGIWNDPEQAERITAIGRDILAQIIQYVVQTGGQPIEADTDGLYFVPPEQIKSPEQQEQYVRDLSATLPEGIEVGLQGTYDAMLSYADKNYALLGHSGNVIIHGSALRSQGLEPYLRRFLKEAIGHMLRGEFAKVIELHRDMNARIVNREAPIEWFVRSDKLRESLEDYQRKVECGARGRSAAYELAQSCGGRFGSGDRIRYYFSGSGRVESPKLAEEFRADAPDYSIVRYMRRLDEMLEMLTPLFPPTLQNSLDGQLDLFG